MNSPDIPAEITEHAAASFPVFDAMGMSVLQHAWPAHTARLGPDMAIRRALPGAKTQSIGPFVFMDHVGPMPSPRQSLAAHPHAGIEVITYLIEGANEHRDSFGNRGQTHSGGAQWLTAGRGMLHAERIGETQDGETTAVFNAVQLWTRLPIELENCEPRYRAVAPEQIPEYHAAGITLRLVAGASTLFLAHGPVKLAQDALLMHMKLEPGASTRIDLSLQQEFGLYVVSGELCLGERHECLPQGHIAVLEKSDMLLVTNTSNEPGECLLLGGEPAPQPLVYHGSFVFNSASKALEAERAFVQGLMGTLDGVPF